jgi:hypothetical protein
MEDEVQNGDIELPDLQGTLLDTLLLLQLYWKQ